MMKAIFPVVLVALSQVSGAAGPSVNVDQQALDKHNLAVVCASETTSEFEDAAVRLNKKLLALDSAGRGLKASAPVGLNASGRNVVCVTVTRE